MLKSIFLLFSALFIYVQNTYSADYFELDPTTSTCSRNAIADNINSWMEKNNLPSSQKPASYKDLYQSLQTCGVFSSEVSFEAQGDLTFGRSYSFKDTGHVSVSLPSGQRVSYQVKKTNGKYIVREVTLDELKNSNSRRRSTRLYSAVMSDEEKKNVIGKKINDCKITSPKVLDAIESNVKSWLETKIIPSWENKHQGYEELFNDLKKMGIFEEKTKYKHSVFGRSHTFMTTQYGNPRLSIKVGDDRYEFDINPTEKKLLRPPSCDEKMVAELNNAIESFNKQKAKEPDSSAIGEK